MTNETRKKKKKNNKTKIEFEINKECVTMLKRLKNWLYKNGSTKCISHSIPFERMKQLVFIMNKSSETDIRCDYFAVYNKQTLKFICFSQFFMKETTNMNDWINWNHQLRSSTNNVEINWNTENLIK